MAGSGRCSTWNPIAGEGRAENCRSDFHQPTFEGTPLPSQGQRCLCQPAARKLSPLKADKARSAAKARESHVLHLSLALPESPPRPELPTVSFGATGPLAPRLRAVSRECWRFTAANGHAHGSAGARQRGETTGTRMAVGTLFIAACQSILRTAKCALPAAVWHFSTALDTGSSASALTALLAAFCFVEMDRAQSKLPAIARSRI